MRLHTGALQADVTAGTCNAHQSQLLLTFPHQSGLHRSNACHPRMALQVLPVADCTVVSVSIHRDCEALPCGLACMQLQLDLGLQWEAALAGGRRLAAAKVTLVGMPFKSEALVGGHSCQFSLLTDATEAA